jgi:hypothetical protein
MPLPTDSRLTEKTSLACGKISFCRARYLFHEATKALELPALTDQAYQFRSSRGRSAGARCRAGSPRRS